MNTWLAALQGMEVNGDVELNVSILATNWQNQMDFASALVKALWPMQAESRARQVVPGSAPPVSGGRRVVTKASKELCLEAH